MRLPNILATLLIACLAAACQTTGSGVSSGVADRLERDGFKPTSIADLNKDLTTDDIITTAAYECETPRCRADMQISFGRDPGNLAITEAELASLSTATRVRIARYLNSGVNPGTFVNVRIKPLRRAPSGLGIIVTAELSQREVPDILRGTRFFVGLVYLQRGGPGRTLAVAGSNGAEVRRYTDPALLD
jgi:hypothetical protein